mmetsp:Transcript_2388/g.8650  ORF Transcript_2388/g.8650 Transcript_2388/m.8650 type:complete len:230 (+) Transcript_2388:485-1174(+)
MAHAETLGAEIPTGAVRGGFFSRQLERVRLARLQRDDTRAGPGRFGFVLGLFRDAERRGPALPPRRIARGAVRGADFGVRRRRRRGPKPSRLRRVRRLALSRFGLRHQSGGPPHGGGDALLRGRGLRPKGQLHALHARRLQPRAVRPARRRRRRRRPRAALLRQEHDSRLGRFRPLLRARRRFRQVVGRVFAGRGSARRRFGVDGAAVRGDERADAAVLPVGNLQSEVL